MVGVIFADTVGESVGVTPVDTAGYGDGEINIIFIALSSGTGDNTFFPDIRSPTIIETKTRSPIITVTAASVRRRSSILRV